MRCLLTVIALIAFLSGCAGITLVEPKEVKLAGKMTVTPTIAWNKLSYQEPEIWTINGTGLDAIRFLVDVKDGATFFKTDKDKKQPKFSGSMRPTEIMEFVVDSFAGAGAVAPVGENLRPAKFGGHRGFRFDMSYASKSGLRYQSLAVGAKVKDRLFLIVFSAPKQHYFGRYRKDVEALIKSVKL